MLQRMEKIVLYSQEGAFVAYVYIPPFLNSPKVLLWGVRTFVWNEEKTQYREDFAYWVPPHHTVSS